MTAKEAVLDITKAPKWYIGIYKQQTASAIIKRFNEGRLSTKKLNEFMLNFGYSIQEESQWVKK